MPVEGVTGPFGIGPKGWTAIFTAVLAVTTIVLAGVACVQIKFLIQADLTATKAANAAALTADALRRTERGVVREIIESVNMKDAYFAPEMWPNSPSMGGSEATLTIDFKFKNYGKAPVDIFEMCGDIVISKSLPEPGKTLPGIDKILREYTVAPQSETEIIRVITTKMMSWKEKNEVVRGQTTIWFVGVVIFNDVFGILNSREYIWKFNRRSKTMRPHQAQEKYNSV